MARELVIVFYLVAAAFAQELFELNVIHYNDFHAHFDEVTPEGTPCMPGKEPCVGGIARLDTAIKQVLEDEPDSLLLNAGDTFQGTIWYKMRTWNVSSYFMNLLPRHDAHVLGNHEFDHGVEGLIPYLERLNCVMLGANVNAKLEPELQPLFQSRVVVERKGRKIGIIGVLLREVDAPIGNVIMENEVETVNREADILTRQGVDIIIVLSHCGLDRDRFIAANVVKEVDLIVGGHSHTLLYNGDTPNGDYASDTYPVYVTQESGHTIPIVQASAYTKYLGNVKLYINEAGIVVRSEGQPIFLGSSIVQDPVILEKLKPWSEEIYSYGRVVFGRSLVTLSRSCRTGECNLGSWVCDGFLQQTMSLAEEGQWNHAHLCFINNGGLRVQISSGELTTEALLMALPFENMVQSFDLDGRYLLEALEFSVSGNINPDNFSGGRMLQYGGIRIVFNATAPSGSRVQSAAVRCIECDVPRYEPLDLDKTYRVLTISYIGDGGSGYTMLTEHRRDVKVLEVDYKMLQEWARYEKNIIQGLDGRVQVVT